MEDEPIYKTGTEDLTQEEMLNDFVFDERLTLDSKELFFIVNAIDYCIANHEADLAKMQMMKTGMDMAWNKETVKSISSKLKMLVDKFYDVTYYR